MSKVRARDITAYKKIVMIFFFFLLTEMEIRAGAIGDYTSIMNTVLSFYIVRRFNVFK